MFKVLLLAPLLVQQVLGAVIQQLPLKSIIAYEEGPQEIIDILYEVNIIPDIIDPFVPQLRVHVSWPNTSADLGNTPNVSLLQTKPEIWFTNISNANDIFNENDYVQIASKGKGKGKHHKKKTTQLTLAMTDPDAPSRENPAWGQICHWLTTNVPLNTSTSSSLSTPVSSDTSSSSDLSDTTSQVSDTNKNKHKRKHNHKGKGRKLQGIVGYKPPGPPPKTGKHRYVFLALAPLNGTTEKLHLTSPANRKHWGYAEPGMGVREWMSENGLGVVGANFIFAENGVQ